MPLFVRNIFYDGTDVLPAVIYTKTSKQPLQQQELFVCTEEESGKVLYSYGTIGLSLSLSAIYKKCRIESGGIRTQRGGFPRSS